MLSNHFIQSVFNDSVKQKLKNKNYQKVTIFYPPDLYGELLLLLLFFFFFFFVFVKRPFSSTFATAINTRASAAENYLQVVAFQNNDPRDDSQMIVLQ